MLLKVHLRQSIQNANENLSIYLLIHPSIHPSVSPPCAKFTLTFNNYDLRKMMAYIHHLCLEDPMVGSDPAVSAFELFIFAPWLLIYTIKILLQCCFLLGESVGKKLGTPLTPLLFWLEFKCL